MRYSKKSLILVFILLIISIGSVSANDEDILSDSSNISDCGSIGIDNSDSTYSEVYGSNSLMNGSSSAVSNGASSISDDSVYYKSNDVSISVSDIVSDVSSNSIENYNPDKTDSLNNIYSSGKVISITPDNYMEYFSEEGKVNTSKVSPYDTLDFSGKFNFPNGINDDDLLDISFIFTIPVIVTSINHDAYFKDSTIQFDHVNASLNAPSVVSNLNINNTLCSGLNGVLCTFSQYVLIMNNTIFTESSSGNPVRLGFSNYINVTNNALKTYYASSPDSSFNQSWTHSCILLAESHYNYIGSNIVEVKESNPIYLSAYGVGPSNYNIIFNNTISSYSVSNVTGLSNPSSWTYGIQMMGNHNQAINNTIHNVFRGISCGDNAFNNTIVGNIIFNITGGYYEGNTGTEGGEYAIFAVPNCLIANNTIYNSSLNGGAIAVSSDSTVYGNVISISKSDKGIVMSQVSNNSKIYENIINTYSGTGLYASTYMSNVTISNNVINSNNGTGIHIKRASVDKVPSNILINNNYIQTGGTFINLTDAGSNNISCINNTLQKAIFINKNNFFNYFDNNATLINQSLPSGAYIIFEGEFGDLNISQITINQAVKIFGNNSIMKDIQFNIVSDDVTVENVHMIMEDNKPAIYLNNVNNFKIFNSNLISLNFNINGSLSLDDGNAEDYVKNINSIIFVDKSVAYIYSNNISTDGCLAIFANSRSTVIVSNNIINTSTFNYTINLTDSGSETFKNNVSNNLLISENSLGTTTVLFNGSANNNILADNDCISTNLVILKSSVFVNSNPIVQIKIVDLQNNPLSNLLIKIIVKESNGNLLNYSVISDSKGIVSLDLSLAVGNYSVYALFEGNSIYNSSNLSSDLEVKYMDTAIVMSAPDYYYSENVIITVYLKGDDGAVDLNDKSIILDVNGEKYYSKTVNGLARFELGNLHIGNYIVKSTFEADENCTGSEVSSSFKVGIMPTSLDVNDVTVMYNNGSNLIVYLTDIDGKAIASKSVSITINGKTYTKVTNDKGKVSLSLNTLVPKTYTANISFSGDSYYSAVKKTIYVKVQTRSTKIVASNLVKYYGDSKNLVVYLKDSNNVAISGKTVSIKINGKTYKKTTDKNGKVSLSISSLPKKSYKTVIKFSATYYGSSSKTITVNVVKPTIKALSTSIKKGKKLSIVFKDYKGKIITYKKVYFKFKGKTYSLTTNNKGISTLTCNIKKGLYSIVAGFKPTTTYGKTTATIKFKVY